MASGAQPVLERLAKHKVGLGRDTAGTVFPAVPSRNAGDVCAVATDPRVGVRWMITQRYVRILGFQRPVDCFPVVDYTARIVGRVLDGRNER